MPSNFLSQKNEKLSFFNFFLTAENANYFSTLKIFPDFPLAFFLKIALKSQTKRKEK